MSEVYNDEPATIAIDPGIQRAPYEPATESADPFVGKDGLDDAASEVSRGRETRETLRRFVRDPENLDLPAPSDVTITPATAAASLAHNRNLEAQSEQSEIDRATAAAVDDVRAGEPQSPELGQQPQPELQPQAEYAPPAEPTELDRLLAPLPPEQRPHFVAAFNQMVDQTRYQAAQEYQQAIQQAQGVAQQYQQAAAQAIQVGEAVARQPFPELHNVPDAELPAVLGHIARTNPQRHAQIVGHVAQVKQALGQQLHAAQVMQHQQTQVQLQQQAAAQQQAAQQFQQWAATEDSKVDKLLAAETPERRFAIQQEAAQILHEEGLTDQQIGNLWNNDATFRSATSQKLLMKEAKSRLGERGVRAARVTPVPHVVRPGVGEEAVDRSLYADLERQYRNNQSLTPRQAAELVSAKRARR